MTKLCWRTLFLLPLLPLLGCSDDPVSQAHACRAEAIKANIVERETYFVLTCMGAKGYDYDFATCPVDPQTPTMSLRFSCFEKRGSLKQMWRQFRG
jgi:hypothetical protein